MIDRHYLTTDKNGTVYRLIPNPDGPVGTGYSDGAVLEFSGDGKEWRGYFFISPDAIAALADMFIEASSHAKEDSK